MTEQDTQSIFSTEPDPELDHQLLAICRRVRLIAVIGFGWGAAVAVMMLLNGAAILRAFESVLPPASGIYNFLVAEFFILFFFIAAVLYFLYHAANHIRAGVIQRNAKLIAEGFSHFRRFFITMAVFSGLILFANILKLFQ